MESGFLPTSGQIPPLPALLASQIETIIRRIDPHQETRQVDMIRYQSPTGVFPWGIQAETLY